MMIPRNPLSHLLVAGVRSQARRVMASCRCAHLSAQSSSAHPLHMYPERLGADQLQLSALRRHTVVFPRAFCSSKAETTTDTTSEPDSHSSQNEQHEEKDSADSQQAPQDSGDQWREKLLDAALEYVPMHGWSLACVEKAAEEMKLSSAVAGMLKNGAADLVLHFEQRCNKELVQLITDWKEEQVKAGEQVGVSKIIRESVKQRLMMVQPHIESWHEALAMLTHPVVVPDALETLLRLIDDIWCLAGDQSTDFNWYTKRATLAVVYCSTELFMLQDKSAGNVETWEFLDRRLADVGDIGHIGVMVQQALSTAMELGGVSLSTAQKLSRTLPPLTSDIWTRPFRR